MLTKSFRNEALLPVLSLDSEPSANAAPGLPTYEFDLLIRQLISVDMPRKVVTPSGNRARGNFPSLKSANARFESLVEEDTWRVLEVSTRVCSFITHPFVLKMPRQDRAGVQSYTPDGCLQLSGSKLLLEAKGDWLLQLPRKRETLLETIRNAKSAGVPLALITESDVRPEGMQDELKQLLRMRPSAGLRRRVIDPTLWDPLGTSEPDAQTLRRWREAQKSCDELLDRVMKRDPGEYVEAIAATC